MKKLDIKYNVNSNGCFEVTSHALDGDGYPMAKRGGKSTPLHRIVFNETYPQISIEGKCVIHKCGNTKCVNPEHLFCGDQESHATVRLTNGTTAKGEHNGRSKLKETEVVKIFLNKKDTNAELSRRYGVDRKVIRDIKSRKKWQSVTEKLST